MSKSDAESDDLSAAAEERQALGKIVLAFRDYSRAALLEIARWRYGSHPLIRRMGARGQAKHDP